MKSVVLVLRPGQPLVHVVDAQPVAQVTIGERSYIERRFGADLFLGF